MNDENRYAPPRANLTAAPVDAERELASRGARLAGVLIDGLLALLVATPFLTGANFELARAGEFSMGETFGSLLLGMVIVLVLHGYLLHKSGQTIGKRLMGTRIVSASDGQILPLGKVFGLRYVPIQVVSAIPVLGFIVVLIDAVLIFREDRRCLHDLIAGTKVVKA